MFSGRLFSQNISLSDLIGIWKWGSGKNYNILTFKSDAIFSINVTFNKNRWSYKLDSLNNEYFLETLPSGSETMPVAIYKLNKINQDSLTIQLVKRRAFDRKTKSWYQKEPHDKSIEPLVRLNSKQNP